MGGVFSEHLVWLGTHCTACGCLDQTAVQDRPKSKTGSRRCQQRVYWWCSPVSKTCQTMFSEHLVWLGTHCTACGCLDQTAVQDRPKSKTGSRRCQQRVYWWCSPVSKTCQTMFSEHLVWLGTHCTACNRNKLRRIIAG